MSIGSSAIGASDVKADKDTEQPSEGPGSQAPLGSDEMPDLLIFEGTLVNLVNAKSRASLL